MRAVRILKPVRHRLDNQCSAAAAHIPHDQGVDNQVLCKISAKVYAGYCYVKNFVRKF